MLQRFVGALIFWLAVFEGVVDRAGLRGLSWGGGVVGAVGGLAYALRTRPSALALAAALPLAVVAQLALAAVARRTLDPKLALLPAAYANRQIERIDIPGAHGPVPALHVVPSGGARVAVCVAHGSGCDKTFYAWRLVEALVARGIAVLLVDLDGHGESPRPQAFPEIVESVAGPARWLREHYKRIGLLGMSLGGAVTARAVADAAPCDALALWAVPPRLRLSADDYRRVQLAEARRIARPTLLHLFRDGAPYFVVRAWQTSGIRASIGTWDLFDALDLLGSLGRIAVHPGRPPLLLIYAGRDAVLPPGADREVASATAGWASFHTLPGASHVSLPIEPETIALTTKWLEAQLKP